MLSREDMNTTEIFYALIKSYASHWSDDLVKMIWKLQNRQDTYMLAPIPWLLNLSTGLNVREAFNTFQEAGVRQGRGEKNEGKC